MFNIHELATANYEALLAKFKARLGGGRADISDAQDLLHDALARSLVKFDGSKASSPDEVNNLFQAFVVTGGLGNPARRMKGLLQTATRRGKRRHAVSISCDPEASAKPFTDKEIAAAHEIIEQYRPNSDGMKSTDATALGNVRRAIESGQVTNETLRELIRDAGNRYYAWQSPTPAQVKTPAAMVRVQPPAPTAAFVPPVNRLRESEGRTYLVNEYASNGRTLQELANEVGTTISKVRRALMHHSIPMRKQGPPAGKYHVSVN